jgi:hypothetical protein
MLKVMEHILERLKWQRGTLSGMLSLHHKDGGQKHLWAFSVFSKKFQLSEKEKTF